jgi:hypothetical protein
MLTASVHTASWEVGVRSDDKRSVELRSRRAAQVVSWRPAMAVAGEETAVAAARNNSRTASLALIP